MVETLRVKKLTAGATLPSRGKPGDAGLDLYALHDDWILSPDPTLFETGIAVEIPEGHVGLICGRSGLAAKKGVDVLGGVIDANYRGEIKVALSAPRNTQLEAGDRIAQLLVLPVAMLDVIEVDELSDSNRGDLGFGSSGR
jgi:dUTP pyrophosphatase